MLDPICTINVFGWLATVDKNNCHLTNILWAKCNCLFFFVARPQEIFPKVKEGSLKNYLDMNV
jgi:hypothetical protein